jgi:hypothetical protein
MAWKHGWFIGLKSRLEGMAKWKLHQNIVNTLVGNEVNEGMPQRRTTFDMLKIFLTFITFEWWFYHNLV